MPMSIPSTPEDFVPDPIGPLRLLPSAAFAARATALATVALPVAMLAVSTLAHISGHAEALPMHTTCCAPPPYSQ